MKTIKMNTDRIPYVDNLKGLAILLVVISHVFAFCVPENYNGEQHIVHRVIYSFHMPLFMALSGYVAKFTLNQNLFYELLKKFRT
ncbi:acyltransferase family protein [uncultured Bacteroides sp.]|uniref:acyltransferase family protein n=1 Tax=uncultured Bacteroides sp. TaxID=162156 RepID=UPI0025DB4B5B|nr:acyltransferase family protein [uncultured Bacteroides sp.]